MPTIFTPDQIRSLRESASVGDANSQRMLREAGIQSYAELQSGIPAAAPTTAPAPAPAATPALMSPAAMAALRNEILAAVRPGMGGTSVTAQSLLPFLQGQPGSSPMADAAIEAFKVKTLPVIQNQMTLRGLGHSPAVSQVTGETMAMALPEFINADMTNRLRAAELMNAERNTAATLSGNVLSREGEFGLAGTKLAADIGNQEAMRQIEASRTSGQLQLGVGDLEAKAAQLAQEQQKIALLGGQGAGGLQRDIVQQSNDAIQAERLRLQGLSEGSSFGVFGGSVIPPSLSQTTRGRTTSDK